MNPDRTQFWLALIEIFRECLQDRDEDNKPLAEIVDEMLSDQKRPLLEWVAKQELRRQAFDQGIKPRWRRRAEVNKQLPDMIKFLEKQAQVALDPEVQTP